MNYEKFETFDTFVDTLKSRKISHVVLRHIRETRPTFDKRSVTVGHTESVTLLAYDKPAILTLDLPDTNYMDIESQLKKVGLSIRKRNANIT